MHAITDAQRSPMHVIIDARDHRCSSLHDPRVDASSSSVLLITP